MSDAGADSPHLAREEREQASKHAEPATLVIHEVMHEEGEQELRKRPVAVWWSGLAAGMSMGSSFLCMSMLGSMLPAALWCMQGPFASGLPERGYQGRLSAYRDVLKFLESSKAELERAPIYGELLTLLRRMDSPMRFMGREMGLRLPREGLREKDDL